ncbi:hypothetical protein [Sutcliffiella sp. FSL R7-0096]|uniref:hypothetical protein n=1 Tax=Sutcliffiella sp. FSL R7-0096 TaxID=2921670 RepID=UPI00315A14FA
MKTPELKEKLTELGVEFDKKATREQLTQLLEQKQAEKNETEETLKEELELEPDPITYVVIRDFKDLQDNNTVYIAGDIYPRRAESDPDEERIQELLSSNNKIGKPLIKEQA